MSSKAIILALVIVVVAAAAAGGAYWYFQIHNGEIESDYTLLDSESNIKAGFTVEAKGEGDHSNSYQKYTVNSVTDDRVYYDYIYNSETDVSLLSDVIKFSDFTPSGTYIPFNYAGYSLPDGITVTKSGNTYIINGTCGDFTKYKYENLKVTYNTSVIAVDGIVTMEINESGTSGSVQVSMVEKNILELDTTNGVLGGTYTVDGTQTYERNMSSFCRRALPNEFDASEFSGATILTSKGKLGNVDVTIYTVNGVVDGRILKDCKFYVYNGYTLKTEYDYNGEKGKTIYSVYMSK